METRYGQSLGFDGKTSRLCAGVCQGGPVPVGETAGGGGVADHRVTQMLRQSGADVFKLYSQAKLGMLREAVARLDRQATEREGISSAVRLS